MQEIRERQEKRGYNRNKMTIEEEFEKKKKQQKELQKKEKEYEEKMRLLKEK